MSEVQTCQACGEDNTARARFCSACGTRLMAEGTAPHELRKTISVVFCDLTGSTSMGEQLDSESLRRVMLRYYAEMRFALERHGGTVEKFIGDAVMAVFGIPVLREDDALRAVRSAMEMKESLARLNDELQERWGVRLRTRTGVNTGEVVTGEHSDSEGLVVGDAINVAARLEQAAAPDEILIGAETLRLVSDVVEVEPVDPLELKGKAEKVPAFRLLSVSEQAPLARRLDSPLVGRDSEQAELELAFERAIAEGRCELLTVLGDPGVGKSRLAFEFLSTVRGQATVLHGRCLPYGEGITFWPVGEAVKEAAGIGGDDSPEVALGKIGQLVPGAEGHQISRPVAGAIGLSPNPYQSDETFWAIRRLFETIAQERPLVVVFDDIHWGEDTFFDLLEYIADTSGAAPVLLLCLARDELEEKRPSLAGPNAERPLIEVQPLPDDAANRLVENLLGQSEHARALAERISANAQGNPLFVEEMLRMLVDEGVLRREDGRWELEGEVAEIGVPPTIEALLGARLDRLESGQRGVLERASVIGKEFWLGAVSELSPKVVRPEVASHLESLVGKDLVERGGPTFAGENAYRFGHILVRDVAYGGLLKEARSLLHERFAGWLEDKSGERIGEYGEILGYHLEQAFVYCRELGPLDDRAGKLAGRAFRFLSVSGTDAHARGDMPAAAKLLDRSLGLLLTEDEAEPDLMLKLAQALCHVGDMERAGTLCDEAAVKAAHLGQRGMELYALLERADMDAFTSPESGLGRLSNVAEEAIPLFEELDDEVGLARSWRALGVYHSDACRWGAATQALERALRYAEHTVDREVYTQILGGLATAFSVGPIPVDLGIKRLEEVLEDAVDTAESPNVASVRVSFSTHALLEAWGIASLRAMRGDFDEARRLCTNAQKIVGELGQTLRLASLGVMAGRIEMLADAPVAAERQFRSTYQTLEAIGDKNVLSTVAAELAEALYVLGRYQEAGQLARHSEQLAAPEDVESQIRWRAALAKVLAQRGLVDEAETLAREAVEQSITVEFPNLEACAHLALAAILRLAGRPLEAISPVASALALYEAKGNRVAARKAKRVLERLRSLEQAAVPA